MIVIDASAVIEVLLQTPAARGIEGRIFAGRESLHAPHLLDVEVAQVLRRYSAVGEMDPARAEQGLRYLADLPMIRHPHTFLLGRIWELRHNFTAYDAVYVALAEALSAPLVTRDQRLARASGHQARIELL